MRKICRGIERVYWNFRMFCNCTDLDSKEITASFQKSKSLGTGVVFWENIKIKKMSQRVL